MKGDWFILIYHVTKNTGGQLHDGGVGGVNTVESQLPVPNQPSTPERTSTGPYNIYLLNQFGKITYTRRTPVGHRSTGQNWRKRQQTQRSQVLVQEKSMV